jgi:hypothetical protein
MSPSSIKISPANNTKSTQPPKPQSDSFARWPYIFPVALGILFAVCTTTTLQNAQLRPTSLIFLLLTLFFPVCFSFLFTLGRWLIINVGRADIERKQNAHSLNLEDCNINNKFTLSHTILFHIKNHLSLEFAPISVFLASLILALCWIPYLITLFPGVYWYDTTWQLSMFFTPGQPISDHHPFLTTYLYGAFANIGIALANNPVTGLYLLILIQCMISIAIFAAGVCYLYKWDISWPIRFTVLLFIAVFPFFPAFLCSLAKDTLATPWFILLCILNAEIIRTRGNALASWKFSSLFFLAILAFSLTKKTGVYICAVILLILLVTHFSKKIKMIIIALVVMVFTLILIIVPKAIMPALGVTPGESNEIVAVPLQQVANIARNDGFLPKDEDDLEKVYGMTSEQLKQAYRPYVADPIKGYPSMDMLTLLRMWLTQGAKHPVTFLSAWAGLSASWFMFYSPSMPPDSGTENARLNILTNSNHYDTDINKVLSWHANTFLGTQVSQWFSAGWSRLPGISTLTLKSFWASILPTFLVFCIFSTRRSRGFSLLILLPVLINSLTLYAGPTSIYSEALRYLFPQVCVLPLIVVILSKIMRDEMLSEKLDSAYHRC